MDLEPLIAAIQDEIQTAEHDLAVAKEAAASVASIEAELARARAALIALRAPQSPQGRKRIADGQRKRRKKDDPAAVTAATAPSAEPTIKTATMPSAALAVRCDQCHTPILGDGKACRADGCEMNCHDRCMDAHRKRFHTEGSNV